MWFLFKGLLLFVFLVWMPGLYLCRRWLSDSSFIERVAVGLGFGIIVVCSLAFFLSLSTSTSNHIGYLALFALPLDLLLFKELMSRAREHGWRSLIPKPDRHEVAVLALTVLIAGFYSVRYFREVFSYTCLNRDTARLLGFSIGFFDWPLSFFEPSETLFANTILISPFPMFFGFFGFRLALAVHTALISLLAYLLATRLTGRRWIGVATMLFLVTTPAYLVNYIMDANILTLVTTMLFCFLAVRKGTSPAALAIAGSIMFGSQHILLFCLLVPLLRAEENRKAFAVRYLGWLALFCFPWFLHHLLAFGNPLMTESYWECNCHPHTFFGLEFEHRGLLNWPFTDQTVRTPYNPLPASMQMALYHLSRMGRIFGGLVFGGAVVLFLMRRRVFVILGLFALPPVFILMIQENWMQVEKWGIPLILYPVVMAAFAFGLDAVARPERRKQFLVVFLACFASTYVFTGLVSGASFPQDERFYDEFPDLPREQDEYVRFEEERLGRVFLYPDYRDVWAELSFRRSLLKPLWRDLRDPDFGREWTDREHALSYMLDRLYDLALHQTDPPVTTGDLTAAFVSGDGEPLLIEISLSEPMTGTEVLRVVDQAGGPVIDLTTGEVPEPVFNIIVPWTEMPQSVAMFSTEDGLPVINFFFRPRLMGDIDYLFEELGIEDRSVGYDAPPRRAPDDKLWFRVDPSRDLLIVDNLCVEPSRIYSWRVRFIDGRPRLGSTFRWRHN